MTHAVDFRALHYEHQHQCCWIINNEDQCGLWCGHDGNHAPYTPGIYLPPPIISPHALLLTPRFACPLCHADFSYDDGEGPLRVVRDGNGNAACYAPSSGPGDIEILWQFHPCGCEGRELLALAPEC